MKNATSNKKNRDTGKGTHSSMNTNPQGKSKKSNKSSRPFYIRLVALLLAIFMILGVVIAGMNSFRY